MSEEWHAVVGFPDYEVSSLGRVRSWKRQGPSVDLAMTPRILRTSSHSAGYPTVALHKFGTQSTRLVHTLVAEAFIGPRQAGMQVCHGDGVPTNNRVENLRYGTAVDNAADRRQHGNTASHERHPMARLTPIQVAAIRAEYETASVTISDLSRKFGIGRKQIRSIVRNESWCAA